MHKWSTPNDTPREYKGQSGSVRVSCMIEQRIGLKYEEIVPTKSEAVHVYCIHTDDVDYLLI